MIASMPRLLLLGLLAGVLAACTTTGGRMAKAGQATDLHGLQVQSKLDWTRIRGYRIELWTIDGPQLNSLFIVAKIKPGEQVLRASGKQSKSRPDGAWYRQGMRPDAVRDTILDAMRAQGWDDVDSSNFRPHQFGDVPGMRFDVRQTSGDGLIYGGSVAAFEHDGMLNVLYWYAPLEHYHPRDVAAVEQMLDAVRLDPP